MGGSFELALYLLHSSADGRFDFFTVSVVQCLRLPQTSDGDRVPALLFLAV